MSKRLQNQQILIEAVRSGDAAAFTQLVSLYQGPLRAFIAGRTSLVGDVDDIAQESFILAYNKIAELVDTEAFGSWLYAIAANLLRRVGFAKSWALLFWAISVLKPIGVKRTVITKAILHWVLMIKKPTFPRT